MRTKPILIATLALLSLIGACHRKSGGGYLGPTPVHASATR